MAIQNLVTIAIDEGEKTSNKLKALELIGKMSEVSLFSETKTHVHLHNSADIKVQLIEGLRQAFSNSRQVNDLAKRKAESLLVELSDPRPMDETETPPPFVDAEPADPPTPDPQISVNADCESLHSIPLKESPADLAQSLLNDLTLTAVNVTNPLESDTCESIGGNPNTNEGEGVIDSGQSAQQVLQGNTPVNVSNEKG